jgi:hypothetical protein
VDEVTADQVRTFLNALDYPASKDDVVAEAEREGAPEPVLRALRTLPLADYASREEILRSVPTVEEGPQPRRRRS